RWIIFCAIRLCAARCHDENCYTMGGVCGQAGLFSTAGDLAIYSQMLLNGGRYGSKRVFRKNTIELFTRRQDLPPAAERWGGTRRRRAASPANWLPSVRSCTPALPVLRSMSISSGTHSLFCLPTEFIPHASTIRSITRAAIHTAVLQALQERGVRCWIDRLIQ